MLEHGGASGSVGWWSNGGAGGHGGDGNAGASGATNRCPVIVGNNLVYVDTGHLTFEYSRLLAPAIVALADRTLAHS